MRLAIVLSLLAFVAAPVAIAQSRADQGDATSESMNNMPRMAQPSQAGKKTQRTEAADMRSVAGMTDMPSIGILGPYPAIRDASGTSWQPDAASAMGGFHLMSDDWTLMGHMMLFGVYDTQRGPRGDDKAFLAGMLMGMVRRDFADGDTLNLRLMLSPDAFMGKDGYPLLVATGETANGTTPLIDRQHPHDLFMELAGSYSHRIGGEESVFLYAGDPGEPALGPTAFPHRASTMDFPIAPITHHWLDSTHIVFGVLTAGFVDDRWKFEVSQFTGREPDQFRSDFDPIRLDSTSVRATWNPDENWSLQTSWGHLKSPEQLDPEIDENRYTASATYIADFGASSSVAATLAWGLKRESDGADLNGLLAEVEYKPADLWTVFCRSEWEQNNEIDATGTVVGVGEVTVGASRDFRVAQHLRAGLGALYTFDFVPSVVPTYGGDPRGAMTFVRVVAD